ncbi:MAG TPA: hypothetical protein VFO77_08365 [Actinoplanes sp.]|nr:hypothetical protein [Actinoplanes sp.]
MGHIVKQVSEHTTHYIWYPGDKAEWRRAGVALLAGLAVFAVTWLFARDLFTAVLLGTSVTAGFGGANYGRRDARALAGFANLDDRKVRRAAVGHTGRAAWRAVAQGCFGAGAAVLILNLPPHGVLADWVLPVVPAVVGALARQGGMLWERLGASASIAGPAKAIESAR